MGGILPDNLRDLGPWEPRQPPKPPKRRHRRAAGITGGILPDSDVSGGPALTWCLPPWLQLRPPPGWFIEIAAPPVRRGRPKKLSPQQRIDVGSYIVNRQWDI